MKVRVEIGNATEYHDWERAEKGIWVELGVKDTNVLRKEIDDYFNKSDRTRHVISPEKFPRTESFVILNNDGEYDIEEDEDIFSMNDYLCTFNLNGIDEDIFVASYRTHNGDFYDAINAVINHQYKIYNVSSEDRRFAMEEIARIKVNDEGLFGDIDYGKIATELEEIKSIFQVPNQKRTFIEFLTTN